MASNPQQGKSNYPKKGQNNQNKPHVTNKHNKPGPSKQYNKNQQKVTANTDDNTKVLDKVLSVLECPVCLGFLQAPVFLCESGHNICGQCRSKLCIPVCPICKNGITGQRNYDVEKIAAALTSPCANSKYGCKYMGVPDDAKAHFEECSYRQYFCPVGREFKKCTWSGSAYSMPAHFAEAHPNNSKLKPGCQVLFDNFTTANMDVDLQLVTIGKKIFLYHVKIDPHKQLAYWGVQYMGPKKEASKYKYEFNIYNSKKPKKVLTYSDECQPENLSFQSVYDSGNCVAVPLHVLDTFIHENKKLTFKFFIKLSEHNAGATSSTKMDIDAFAEKLSLL